MFHKRETPSFRDIEHDMKARIRNQRILLDLIQEDIQNEDELNHTIELIQSEKEKANDVFDELILYIQSKAQR